MHVLAYTSLDKPVGVVQNFTADVSKYYLLISKCGIAAFVFGDANAATGSIWRSCQLLMFECNKT